MCGIVGILKHDEDVSFEILEALLNLQHRGQESSGIMTYSPKDDKVNFKKRQGFVLDNYTNQNLMNLKGNIGIGHVRYSTSGYKGDYNQSIIAEAQPFYISLPFGIMLAHNGNILFPDKLKEYLFEKDYRHINSTSDTDILINLISFLLMEELKKENTLPVKVSCTHVFNAITKLYSICTGAYSVILYIIGFGLVAFRDPFGIRPLVLGLRKTGLGEDIRKEYMVASESVALDILDYKLFQDVGPGEIICIQPHGMVGKLNRNAKLSPCIFEYVYFARQDSIMNGISVYKARSNIGSKLAQKIKKMLLEGASSSGIPPHEIDVVMPVPDASRPSAIKIAHDLGINYEEGIIKNRFTHRTFILPNNKIRKQFLKRKFNTIKSVIQNKNILIVDDSIVRGNTSKHIIQMVKDAGAKSVYLALCSPPLKYPNVYGIDIPTANELIAHNKSIDEISEYLGTTKLIFLDLEDLVDAVGKENPNIVQFDCSVFDGSYVTNELKINSVKDYLSNN